MKVIKSRSLKSQLGVGLVQMALSLSVLAIVTFLAFQRYTEVQDDARNTAAFEETTRWLGEMIGFGVVRSHDYGSFTQIDLINRTTINDATNVYGESIEVAVAGEDWQLTYTFPNNAACLYVLERIASHPGLGDAGPTCADTVLTASVE